MRHAKLLHVLFVVGLSVAIGCATTNPTNRPAPTPATHAAAAAAPAAAPAVKEVSAIGPGLVTGKPGMNRYVTAEPGDSKLVPRGYPTAPPPIPHAIDLTGITRQSNECVDCHDGGDGPKLSASHLSTGKKKALAASRYYCLQCHVPQTTEQPAASWPGR